MRHLILFVGLCSTTVARVDLRGQTSEEPGIPEIQRRVVETLDRRSSEWFSERDIPGWAMAVVSEKEILWQAAHGHLTRERFRDVDAATLFSLQSISKSITALAALRTVQDGLVDLDTPIAEYLPEFTVKSRWQEYPEGSITLRHLLTHRAGLSHNTSLGNYFDPGLQSFEDHVFSISDTWLRYPVGSRISYSNLGFDLAAYIVQRVSGRRFEDYVAEAVFEPFGMVSSTCDIDVIKAAANCAHGHHDDGDPGSTTPPVRIPMLGAGGCYSSVEDMAKFMMFHINEGKVDGGQFLNEDLITDMHSIQYREQFQTVGQGLGIIRSELNSRVYSLSHTGSGYGFRAAMHIYPNVNVGVILLYNSHVADPYVQIGPLLDSLVTSMTQQEEHLTFTDIVADMRPVPPDDERARQITGYYYPEVILRMEGGELVAQSGSTEFPVRLFVDNDRNMHGLVAGGRHYLDFVLPTRDEPGGIVWHMFDGHVVHLDHHHPMPEDDVPGPDTRDWTEFLGKYHAYKWIPVASNVDYFDLTVDNGYLSVNGMRCEQFRPDLYRTVDGRVLDLRGDQPVFDSIRLIRTLLPKGGQPR
jgi:CubicO group peptidase (beta-lactamase class C family)